MATATPFVDPTASNDALASAIAQALKIALPPACIPGVAANARIVQQHIDTLRRDPR